MSDTTIVVLIVAAAFATALLNYLQNVQIHRKLDALLEKRKP